MDSGKVNIIFSLLILFSFFFFFFASSFPTGIFILAVVTFLTIVECIAVLCSLLGYKMS